MADMTDSSYCQIVKRLGNPIIFREMISAEAIFRGNLKSVKMGFFDASERPIIQQLFGSDPETMAKATKIIDEKYSPDGFDINMGCPVYKIVSNFNGAALMNDPERAAAIVHAMKAATKKPVSVKIRLGWKDPTQCIEFARVLEEAGADLITVHGRTKAQGYTGVADWKAVRAVKDSVKIPVLINGDITDSEKARQALEESGADGIMIGRGALGNPWIFPELEAGLISGKDFTAPTPEERVKIVLAHAELHLAEYGEKAITTFRKHLGWYFKGTRGAKQIRERLVRVNSYAELESLLNEWLKDAIKPVAI